MKYRRREGGIRKGLVLLGLFAKLIARKILGQLASWGEHAFWVDVASWDAPLMKTGSECLLAHGEGGDL